MAETFPDHYALTPAPAAGAQAEIWPRRVLFCTWGYPPAQTGGAERQAHLQAVALKRLGHDVEVVCPAWPGTHSGNYEGVRVTRLPLIPRPKLSTATYMSSLFCFLAARGWQFDLFHVHLAFVQVDVVGVAAFLLRRRLWVKLAANGALGEINRMRRIAILTRYAGLRSADRVQVVSEELAVEAVGIGVRPDRLVRIPNGVDTKRFRPVQDLDEKFRARDELGLPHDKAIALYVGRIAQVKGLHELTEAWRQIYNPNRALVLVGAANSFDPAKGLAGPGLVFSGWSNRPEIYYRAADLFVLASHVEGMSNAILEAMASGVPVITTRVAAAVEMIEPNVSGELIEPGDVAALARSLDLLLGDPALRTRLADAARATVEGRYSIDAVAASISLGYQDLSPGV